MRNCSEARRRSTPCRQGIQCPPVSSFRIIAGSAECALCGVPHNAHHVRELEAIGAAAHQGWAKEMIDLLYEARDVVEKAKEAGKDHLSRSTIRRLRRSYDALLAAGREVNPLAVDHKRHGIDKDAHNLLHRLESYADDVLRFTTNFEVGWSNNQAERDVRLVKLQRRSRARGAPLRAPAPTAPSAATSRR